MPITEPRPVLRRSHGARLRDDDATLIVRMQAGDERAFAAIFKRHHGPLLSYCRHMLGNRDEGEDALQQAFIKAHQALLGGTEPRELRPWLYAIARNCCLSAIAARRPTTPLEYDTPTLAGLADEVRQREDLRELLVAIGRLPEDQRSALLLAELDDLSHEAIAAVVGCPVNKVKALVYQARSALIADRDARDTPCQDIREQLSVARGGELRRGPLRRHLKLCVGCRDFQLAVNAQRQSLAAVLPVLPSAGLAAAILGHGAAHAAGAASIGGAGAGVAPAGLAPAGLAPAGLAPAGGAAGTGVGASATGATVAGGSGVAATGTTAASAAAGVGAGAGGGASVGALVGGGVVTKLAVGGAVVALAAAGAVAARHHPTQGISSRVARERPAPFAMHRGDMVDIADVSDSPYGSPGSGVPAPALPGSQALTPLTVATDAASAAGPQLTTGLTSSGAATPLLTLTGASPPGPGLAASPGLPAANAGQASSSKGSPPVARKTRAAKLRRTALRRRARQLRKARRRARLRAVLRKRLRLRHHAAATKTPKSPKTPAPPVVSVPVRAHHRKVRPAPVPAGTPAVSTTEGESKESKGAEGKRHRVAVGAGSGSTATSTGPETGTTGPTSTGKVKRKAESGTGAKKSGSTTATGTGKAASGTGAEKSSSAADKETGSSTNTGKTEAGGAGATSTGSASDATEPKDATTHASATTGAGERSRKGTTPPPKKFLVEEEQLPNL